MKRSVCSIILAASLGMSAVNPYIDRVLEYSPAPGQFVNEVPWWEDGWTAEDILAEAQLNIAGTASDPMPGMISLGSFGGYVIFVFDHPVVNVEDEYDFKIFGNAIRSDKNGDGGSSEPGIVMVSVDVNGNGIADDPWYELAGSEYSAAATFHNYRITYYRPENDKVATPDPDNSAITDDTYIRWTSNDPEAPSGYVKKNTFHRQNYWPEWNDEEEMTFEGTRLADNAYDRNGEVVLKFLPWGYVDNRPNTEESGFKLDWAVDEDGNPVHLAHADFFKVYTAINAEHGRIGETSTEISGGQDLHPEAEMSSVNEIQAAGESFMILVNGNGSLSLLADNQRRVSVYSVSGTLVGYFDLVPGRNDIDVSSLSRGIYVLTDGVKSVKVVM